MISFYFLNQTVAQLVKNLPAMWESWLWRSPAEVKGYPLQYSGMENSMDCIVHGVAKSQTWPSNFHFHFFTFNLFKIGVIIDQGFPGGSVAKNSHTNARVAGDMGSIPGSERLPRKRNGIPLHYSCWVNPMARGAWWVTVHGSKS